MKHSYWLKKDAIELCQNADSAGCILYHDFIALEGSLKASLLHMRKWPMIKIFVSRDLRPATVPR